MRVEPIILPHGLDPLLEQGVVAAGGQPAGQLYVVVQGPEVLNLEIWINEMNKWMKTMTFTLY